MLVIVIQLENKLGSSLKQTESSSPKDAFSQLCGWFGGRKIKVKRLQRLRERRQRTYIDHREQLS